MRSGLFRLLMLLCCTLGSMTAQAAEAQNTRTLNDFQSAAEIARFYLQGIPPAHFTVVAGDGSGATLVLDRWQIGRPEWPALILRKNRGLPEDWSGYDCLAVDIRNDGTAPLDISYQVRDAQSSVASHHYLLAPGGGQTLRWSLAGIEGVDLAHVAEMQLFATRPRADTTLHISHLRLESDPDARRAALGALADSVAAEFAKRLSEASDAEERRLILREQSASHEVQTRLRAAMDRAEQDTLRTQLLAGRDRLYRQIPREVEENRMRSDFRKIDPKTPYACGFATSMEKVCPVDIPFHATVSRSTSLSLAGNETESLQLLVLAGSKALPGLKVTASPLKRTGGAVPAGAPAPTVRISPVGFVHTVSPPYKVDYIGWYPDPILDFQPPITVKPGEMQPMWIRVFAPSGTPAGRYATTLTVHATGAPSVTLNLNVTVWGFDLPKETHLRTAINFREDMLHQVYGDVPEALRQKYYRFLLQYRLNPDGIYRTATPHLADLEQWDKLGMNAFNLIYVPKPKDVKAGMPYPAAQKEQILAELDAIIPQLKAHGLYSRAYVYGFDEVNPESFAAIKDMYSAIKAKYPDLPLLTTGRDATYGLTSSLSMVDGWVPLTPAYDPARAEEARRRGKQVWWYTCIVPQKPYANWFIEYDAIDARSLMGLQTVKYKPDGYLYYAVDRWPLSKKPIAAGPYTDWPANSFLNANGDGSILCAGPDGPLATIRIENIRDGIEDYEYFHLLQDEIAKLKANPLPGSEAALKQAERASVVDASLVRDLTHFSKSPEALYAKRAQVAAAILSARAALRSSDR